MDTVNQIEKVGKEQSETFKTERFDRRQNPVTDPIKQNKFTLFSRPAIKEKSKEKKTNFFNKGH
jgi:ribosomal protein S10